VPISFSSFLVSFSSGPPPLLCEVSRLHSSSSADVSSSHCANFPKGMRTNNTSKSGIILEEARPLALNFFFLRVSGCFYTSQRAMTRSTWRRTVALMRYDRQTRPKVTKILCKTCLVGSNILVEGVISYLVASGSPLVSCHRRRQKSHKTRKLDECLIQLSAGF